MSEPRFESILREAAPPAPQQLRDRVRALPEPTTGRAWRLRPALAAAALIAVAVGIGAAAIGGLTGSTRSVHWNSQAAGRAIGPRLPSPGSSRSLAHFGQAFDNQVIAPTLR